MTEATSERGPALVKVDKLKLIDKVLGTPSCVVLGLADRLMRKLAARPGPLLGDVKNILVVKTVGIGDVVLAFPTIAEIRKCLPRAKISVLVTPRVRGILEGHPAVDEIIYYDVLGRDSGLGAFLRLAGTLKEKKFDLFLDLEHYYRFTTLLGYFSGAPLRFGFDLPGQGRRYLFTHPVPYDYEAHEVEAFLAFADALGCEAETVDLQPIAVGAEDRKKVDEILSGLRPSGPVVALHPGTSDSAISRRWLPERWAEVGDRLAADHGASLILTGSEADMSLVEEIRGRMKTPVLVAAGLTDLKQFAELASRVDVFISVDTGPLHIAAAQGAAVVGLYGPNTPDKWGPYGRRHIAIYRKLDCSPCTRQYLGQVSTCTTGECMNEIHPRAVVRAAERILRREGKIEGSEAQPVVGN